mgnify:CR=1 FL=1
MDIIRKTTLAVAITFAATAVQAQSSDPAWLDRLFRPVTRLILRPIRAAGPASPLLAGLAWGALPCAMVYAALLYAMISGSALQGALVMLGFGLGTLPSVTGTALGIGALQNWGRVPGLRIAAGLTIAAMGGAMLLVPPELIAAMCGMETGS